MCETATHVSVSDLTFTDHIGTEKQKILNCPAARKEYVVSIHRFKQHYGNSLTILCGYEFSSPRKNYQLGSVLEKCSFDYWMINLHRGDTISRKDFECVALWRACGGERLVLDSDAHDCRKIGECFCVYRHNYPLGLKSATISTAYSSRIILHSILVKK